MLTLTDIRVNSEELIQRLEIRGIEAKDFIHKALNLDSEARNGILKSRIQCNCQNSWGLHEEQRI